MSKTINECASGTVGTFSSDNKLYLSLTADRISDEFLKGEICGSCKLSFYKYIKEMDLSSLDDIEIKATEFLNNRILYIKTKQKYRNEIDRKSKIKARDRKCG